jgi:NAD(P)-dependent dehydrogenase (short-subunit alcohol dehydrogenase family)
MDLQLKNKVVLITGGSKGIGLACARTFAAEGARVAIAARNIEQLNMAASQLKSEGIDAFVVSADLMDPAQAAKMVAAVVAKLGPIDVLVNSAGGAKRATPAELTPALWDAAMKAKYFTYIHAMDAVLPDMKSRRSGTIVNVIGVGGRVASVTHLAGGAANAALMLATTGLAKAYAPDGIRINGVNPGPVQTERLTEGAKAQARLQGVGLEEMLKQQSSVMPLLRVAQPEEIADTVVYLASPRASYVTGAIVAMDGAHSAVP